MSEQEYNRFRPIGGDTVQLREGQHEKLKYPEGTIRHPLNHNRRLGWFTGLVKRIT